MFAASVIQEKEIFQNERFIPMSGWSAKGLLVTGIYDKLKGYF